MDPCQIAPQAGIVVERVIHEDREHPIMVAFEHNPRRAGGLALHEIFDNAFAIGPAITQIADMHHLRAHIAAARAVLRDQRMGPR